MKLVYAMARRQIGKVVTPLKVVSSAHAGCIGMFAAKISKLDKKLAVTPRRVMLIRERVARIRCSEFCIDIGTVVAIKAQMNEPSSMPEEYRTIPFRCGARGAGLCDGTDARQAGQPGYVCTCSPLLFSKPRFARLFGW